MVLHLVGQLFLVRERFVELHLRQLRPHDVEDIGLDLDLGVRQLVERVKGLLEYHLILHANNDVDKNIILGLCFAVHVELPHSQ